MTFFFQSSQIGSVCFMIDWYQLPAKTVRSLVLVIAMSSHPIKISAGRMIDLSLATFGIVRNCVYDIYICKINPCLDIIVNEINQYPKIIRSIFAFFVYIFFNYIYSSNKKFNY